MQKVVRKNFQAMKTKSWTIIDAKQSIEKLAEQIHEIAKHSIEEASKKPLGKLWKY
jgi:thymidylate kinase